MENIDGIKKYNDKFLRQYFDLFNTITGLTVGVVENQYSPIYKNWFLDSNYKLSKCDICMSEQLEKVIPLNDYMELQFDNEKAIIVPVIVNNQLVASLYCCNSCKDSNKDTPTLDKTLIQKFLQNVSNYLSDAIEAKIYQFEEHTKRKFNELITYGIDFYENSNDILSVICHELCRLYDISSAKVIEFDFEHQTFKLIKQHINAEHLDIQETIGEKKYGAELMKFWLPIVKADTAARVVKNYDLTDEKFIPKHLMEYYKEVDIRSNMAVVINSFEKRQTTLCLFSNKNAQYWDKELDYLRLIAKQISILFDSVRTKSQLREINSTLDAISKDIDSYGKNEIIQKVKEILEK